MKLKDARDNYYFYSGKASDIARQLSFAGLGVVWIFKIDSASGPVVPSRFVLPTLLILVALSCDFLQ